MELLDAVTRFAILAFTPSQHSRHAVLACLAAHTLPEELDVDLDALATACAIYAAQSRPPWSEPPITEPPPISGPAVADRSEIDAAISSGDRLASERWLAARMVAPDFEAEFLEIAGNDLADHGHKLIVSTAAIQLARIMGDKGRYATLRMATAEWTAYREAPPLPDAPSLSPRDLMEMLIGNLVDASGDTISFHAIELYDAALTTTHMGLGDSVEKRVRAHLETGPRLHSSSSSRIDAIALTPPNYPLARDYAQYLIATGISHRMSFRFPGLPTEAIAKASLYNLKHGPSFEDWSFA